MKYLVDADVLSEATKPQPDAKAIHWLQTHEADLVLSPIVLGELQYWILALPTGNRRRRLLDWFSKGVQNLDVVTIDAETALEWAALLADLRRKGRAMPVKDSLIAATARQHGLTVATRNLPDFRHAGVAVVNPFRSG